MPAGNGNQMNTYNTPTGLATMPGSAAGHNDVMKFYDFNTFRGLAELSRNIVASRLYGNVTQEQCFVILQTGMALGIAPTTAMQGIHVIQGKGTLSGQLMVALAAKNGHRPEIIESTNEKAVFRITRGDNGISRTVTYTVQDAKAAGLVGKENWQKHTRAMLLNRAISEACRYTIPDALGGMVYTPEDFGAVVQAQGVTQFAEFVPPPMAAGELHDAIEAEPKVDEEWESLLRQLEETLKAGNTPEDKYNAKIAEWSGHYLKDRAKAIPGLTKYIGTLRAALAKRKAVPAPFEVDAEMVKNLVSRGFTESEAKEATDSRVREWMEETNGDLVEVNNRKIEWLLNNGVAVPPEVIETFGKAGQ